MEENIDFEPIVEIDKRRHYVQMERRNENEPGPIRPGSFF